MNDAATPQPPSDDWHYPRAALADRIIRGFKENLSDRVTLFAPRKRGKTQFLHHDIISRANEAGIFVVYVDFWRPKEDPVLAFSRAVVTAYQKQAHWFTKLLDRGALKASLKLLGDSITLGIEVKPSTLDPNLGEAAFNILESIDRPVLLLLDEVQQLATSPKFEGFTASLRSFMTARSDHKVKGIFTGSSQEGLARLFKRSNAPFYNSSDGLTFASLNEDFVRHQLKVFKKRTGVDLPLPEAIALFNVMSQGPEPFVALLKRMVVEGVMDLSVGTELYYTATLAEETEAYFDKWEGCLSIDRALLVLISRGRTGGFYSDSCKKDLSGLVRAFDEKNPTIQNALTRLKEDILYSPSHGVWAYVDPAFQRFVREECDSTLATKG